MKSIFKVYYSYLNGATISSLSATLKAISLSKRLVFWIKGKYAKKQDGI
jgi:hypothetical protein